MAGIRGNAELPAEHSSSGSLLGPGEQWRPLQADPMETHSHRQENELQVLEAIYGKDFTDLRKSSAWKVKQPPEVTLSLHPQCNEFYVQLDLWVKCPQRYPDVPPEIQLKNVKGLSNENVNSLTSSLEELAKTLCGEVMIYQLADHVQTFLTEHNQPPPKSFHEEMLKNLQRQQEKIALEEEKRIQELKRREEQTRREILDEIQRREEEKKEERRRKEIEKQERLESANLTCQENSTKTVNNGGPKAPTTNGGLADHGGTNRTRTTSVGRSKRDRQYSVNSDESSSNYEVLTFDICCSGHLVVHRGKCLGKDEQLGKSIYNGLEMSSGHFVVIYEWVLQWQKKMGKFLTSQESEKVDRCKKQVQGTEAEFNSLIKLSHPNIVHYLAMRVKENEDSISVGIVAEHVNGSKLSSFLEQEIPVPVDQLRHYTTQLLSALDYLHSNSVVHKVLCASSVLVTGDGRVRLTDYSLSKRLADICKEDVFEQTKVRFSEDALPSKTGKKGDTWKLGLLLLSLSQGKVAKEYPVKVPSDLPSDFQDFLKKCVCLEDKERWGTQQLLGHSFINPPPQKCPVSEESPDDYTGVECTETVIPSNSLLNAAFHIESQRQLSRYFNEFEELQMLGRGAFGAVIKVQNKLDGCYYAVKRVQINPASKHFRRIKGEVTLLSRLNHENIVRYYNAWIEKHEIPSSSASKAETPVDKKVVVKPELVVKNEFGLADDIEANAPAPIVTSSVEWSSSSARCKKSDQDSSDDEDDDDEEGVFSPSFLPGTDSDSEIVFENEDENSPDQDEECAVEGCKESPSEMSIQTVHYLYIQMEYCEKSTLRDTIDQGLYLDNNRLWRLFREILDGLAYIHEQGMIHRDLKPVNIFLDSEDQVKIGDFGLATDHPAYKTESTQDEDQSRDCAKVDPEGKLTGMVGTALYVSPEVQGNAKASYNQKVDLFSLGIILFEMSYRPMDTSSERISVLSMLRQPSIVFPNDFEKPETEKQRKVITWLLNHDPAARPTAMELLKCDLLPPPQLEESELHEVLHHTLANIDGKAYRTMISQIFSQRISPAMDYTYDSDIFKGSFTVRSARIHHHVCETVCRVFKRHGAVKLHTPLLMPRNKMVSESGESACFMDHSGMLVTLPYNLRIPFARFVARNNINNLKRYCIERVFRPRKLNRCHPKELTECAFDVITSSVNSYFPVTETMYTIYEIIQELPVLQERNYSIHLNHTSLLKAILLHCGVPEDKLMQVYTILYDAMIDKLTKREVEAKFCNLSLSKNNFQLNRLYKYIEQKGELQELEATMASLTKQKSAVGVLAKQGLKDLEEVIGLVKKMNIKLQVVVNFGLVYKMQQHNGIIFQFVAFIKRRQRTVPEILAAGGRYDHLISQFKGLQTGSFAVPCAVGVSIAIDKISAALSSADENVSSCDLLVVSAGQMSVNRAIGIIQKLWTAGITAEIMYDWSESQDELQELCRLSGIPFVAIVSDKEGSHVKLKAFEKERQTEKRILESDLVDHLLQKLRLRGQEERNNREMLDTLSGQNLKGSFSGTQSQSEQHSSAVKLSVSIIAPERLSASTRRRYETQVLSKLQTSITNLQQRNTEIEILAVDLPKEAILNLLSLEFVDEQTFNASVKQVMCKLPKQRYLKQIFDEICSIKIERRVPVLMLYSYRDDYYKVLF
ncbi:LOW QUALITY PROTEIN: eIF-2-alpha kinase GCN2 [Bufo gargarizans]|uniref:LOW QUALITY PROTEIN: eIF-2-alpha kinase GCN2 n=1 Tax=Bufo gargarizans TaxID=30331 RepID=UPI001CF505DA|nr:LOW QUALITY PROTEIN: eIF-2-alpha kinase GCN2 [Bufo gargarizans]